MSFTVIRGTTIPTMIVMDQKANGTQGGDSASGANTRVLNTVQTNNITGASLGSNQVTLPAGDYEIEATAPAFNCSQTKAYLYNVTDAATTLVGTSEYGADSGQVVSSRVVGKFTITASKVFELRHYILNAVVSNGLGVASASGQVEIYSILQIRKVG